MSKLYEIVVFTAAEKQYADEILDKLDPKRCLISHRLYRQHTVHMQNNFTHQIHYIKDLERLGRPLSHTIIIDNLKENFAWQKTNGIHIKSFYNNK